MAVLAPNLILPSAGSGSETVNDAVVHYSLSSAYYGHIQEKVVQVYGAIAAGAPGNLLIWVEVAPSDTAALYTRLGGIQVLVTDGSVIIAWTTHTAYARICVQAPGAGATDYWTVEGYISGKDLL